MSTVTVIRILDRDQAIDGLTQLRQEWQEAACGVPLVEVQGSVGLILADVVSVMDPLPEEAAQVLGNETVTPIAQMRLPV
jgi:hypothetical protein